MSNRDVKKVPAKGRGVFDLSDDLLYRAGFHLLIVGVVVAVVVRAGERFEWWFHTPAVVTAGGMVLFAAGAVLRAVTVHRAWVSGRLVRVADPVGHLIWSVVPAVVITVMVAATGFRVVTADLVSSVVAVGAFALVGFRVGLSMVRDRRRSRDVTSP